MPLRPLLQLPLFSAVLMAQHVGPLQFGLGLKSTQGIGVIGEMVGKTPSVGAMSEVRCYFANTRVAFRIRGTFDNWGNQHLRGTIDDRCEVKRLAGTAGFMFYYRDGKKKEYASGLRIGLEFGVARWNIDSTWPPLAKQCFYKPASAFIIGADTQDVFFEFGIELSSIGKHRKTPEMDVGGRVGGCTVTLGYKF